MRTIYGWEEMCEGAWSIEAVETDQSIEELDPSEEDGEVYGPVPDGRWFINFSSAKKAAIRIMKRKEQDAKMALRHLRKLTKKDTYRS